MSGGVCTSCRTPVDNLWTYYRERLLADNLCYRCLGTYSTERRAVEERETQQALLRGARGIV